MKSFYATLLALIFAFISISNSSLAQTADDWEFADRYDGTEDLGKDELQEKTILLPNPLISGRTLQILLPTDMDVQPQGVKVYDAKGAQVLASIRKEERKLFVGTQRLSPGIYIVQVTKAIKKKFVIQ